jgi:hypothetical protein
MHYLAGYEGYGEIQRQLGASAHQNCLLVTSRGQPLRADQTAARCACRLRVQRRTPAWGSKRRQGQVMECASGRRSAGQMAGDVH